MKETLRDGVPAGRRVQGLAARRSQHGRRILYSDEAIMKCDHSQIYDEPPQCAKCSAWVCGNCLKTLLSPVGICLSCDIAVRDCLRDEFIQRKKKATIVERPT